ncbi:hypothetical protein [Streptomyces poonensis]|uniref:DUF1963 domain-containing protein n=1 Tax=Streptomyces poonensis TaxID=68255 RepID=A0A918UND6_9ACTN|nr:hypothetical protein [Streptomyces poonensis]GGZ22618.1 hypothetical protein GCM10010365_48570 [Streptomyces poonensis]GLJ91841.1 hypothetical protein GCM10017589_44490 [Streptomyces poonensis]
MLLIYDGDTSADAHVPRTGGVPLVPDGFVWPMCRECGGAMQFLAHLPLQHGVVAVFFCQNDPGMCDDWDAGSGANKAFLFSGALSPAAVPAEGEARLGAVTALRAHPGDTPADEDVPVLGRLGGEADWLQDDETPTCPSCGTRMTFTASLEEGYDHATSANFGGGGRGYVFGCSPCGEAAFLWQR